MKLTCKWCGKSTGYIDPWKHYHVSCEQNKSEIRQEQQDKIAGIRAKIGVRPKAVAKQITLDSIRGSQSQLGLF